MNQELALGILLSGSNCFLTGAAGAGKTYLLNKFIAHCKKTHKKVAITASTGIAATHLSGNTIHSWSGIGGYDHLPRNFFTKMPKSRAATIKKAEILIIDEISMLHDWFFELLNQVCKQVRENTQPFGGLQIIVSGDFFQLPPVSRQAKSNFATSALAWKEANFATLYLETQHRQDDEDYLEILNRLRDGNYRRHHIEKLLSRVGANLSGDLTQLHTHNYAVDRINLQHLALVSGEEKIYEYTHTGAATYYEKLASNILAPEKLHLKKGALVMAVKNVPEKGFYNGSTGIVIDFEENYPIVEFRTGRKITITEATWELIDGETRRASVTQIPLRLAWAITVHKSQGMTLDAAKIDLSRAFESGMGYVALSRVKSLTSLSLVGINTTAIKVSPKAQSLDQKFRKESKELAQAQANLAKLGKKALHDLSSERKRKRVLADIATPPEAGFLGDKAGQQKPHSRISPKEPSPEEELRKARWAARVAKERETFKNARTPWTLEDSDNLIEGFLKGISIPELSQTLGRKPRSLMMRLNTTFDEEIFSQEELWSRA